MYEIKVYFLLVDMFFYVNITLIQQSIPNFANSAKIF